MTRCWPSKAGVAAYLSNIAICIAGLPFHGYVAMGPMAVNQVTPNQMRAQISSAYLFTVNLIGLGVGPTLVPLISDYVLRDPMQIRWACLSAPEAGARVGATGSFAPTRSNHVAGASCLVLFLTLFHHVSPTQIRDGLGRCEGTPPSCGKRWSCRCRSPP